MSILLNLFNKYWPHIAAALFIGLLVYSFMGLKSDLATTRADLATTQAELNKSVERMDAMAAKYDDLVDQATARETRLTQYYTSLLKIRADYEKTQQLLDGLKEQESLAARNPGEYTAKLKKVYEDSEREFSCITGNLQFCSQ